jgi:hypothetical protein
MSNCGGSSFWVGDLDSYLNMDAIYAQEQRWAKEEAKHLATQREVNEIGDLPLLAGKYTSAANLNSKGITPADWRHALHFAEMTLGRDFGTPPDQREPERSVLECRFLLAMLDLGRLYAVARYAKKERLDYPSAITATLPHGIRALLNQFVASEGIERSSKTAESIRFALNRGTDGGNSAYHRTGYVQSALHSIANDALNHLGSQALDRERTRVILSLTRLHFCVLELRQPSIAKLRQLAAAYSVDRKNLGVAANNATLKRRWSRALRLQHIQPLLYFDPYAIRNGLARAAEVEVLGRAEAVNELALAHCGVLRMRRAGRERTKRI